MLEGSKKEAILGRFIGACSILELYTSNLASLEEWLKQQNLQSSPYLIQEKARLEIQDETFRLDEDVILAKLGPYNFTTKDF